MLVFRNFISHISLLDDAQIFLFLIMHIGYYHPLVDMDKLDDDTLVVDWVSDLHWLWSLYALLCILTFSMFFDIRVILYFAIL